PLINKTLSGKFQYSRGSHLFLMARLIEDGALYKLLNDRCAIKPYALCPYKEQLKNATGDWFLWLDDSPLEKIGGWENSEAQSWPMILDTVRYYPWDVIRGSLKGIASQLVAFQTG